MKKLLAILFLAVITFFACDDPFMNKPFVVYNLKPISNYIDSREAKDLSEWVEILKYADLYNALNQATQAYTAFVPDNDAVRAFYAKKGVSSIEELGKEYAFDLVRYHVIADSIPRSKILAGGKIDKRTISQDYLSISFDDSSEKGGFNAIYINKEARIKELSISVSNGYVYVLEGVLTPMLESVYEKLELNGNFTLFLQALNATGWADSLNTIYDEIRQPNGKIEKRKRDYTVLGVSDAAFASSGINTLDDLKAKLYLNEDFTTIDNELNLYVAYHIMKGNYAIADLTNFGVGKNRKIWGTLAEAIMEISREEDGYYINYKAEEDIRAKLFTVEGVSDILAKNGIIHQVSGYMPIWQSEEPVEVLFDFCDFPEIEAHIRDYGTEGQVYRVLNPSSEYRTEITNLSCFKVEKGPDGTKNPNYNAVDYFTVKDNEWRLTHNADQLIINLGYLGSIEMKTPILIKGKYKITVQVCYANTMVFMRDMTDNSNGGELKFTFDGQHEKKVAVYGGKKADGTKIVSGNMGLYKFVLHDAITFDKTAAHDFKIVVNDQTASTHKDSRFQLDYMLFEPIE